jgi:hypothetical protein
VTSTRRLSLLLWPAGATFGLVAEWVAFGWTDPLQWIPDRVVGWAFIGCGLIAAARRPESRSGALTTVTGFTWFLGNFVGSEAGFVSWIAAHGIYWHRGPLVHLILAYPSGRLSSGLSRVAVGIGYATVAVSPLWDSDVAVFILSALLIAISAREYM